MTIGHFSSVISAAAPAAAEVITLSGTTGSPNANSTIKLDPTDADCSWIFNTDGTIDKVSTTGTAQFQAGVEWCSDSPPTGSYWLRATSYSGSSPTTGTLGSWLALTSTRTFQWYQSVVGTTGVGVIKVEIATDSGGSTIVATGYYQGNATVTS